ncbi:MAG: hypothetical protein AAGA23_22700 [Pseudomonadota bacterium]
MARDTKRPDKPYFGQQSLDDLVRMHTETLSELWILRDRVLVLEHLLEQAGVIPPNAVSTLEPDDSLTEKLKADRDAMVARVVGAAHRKSLDLEEIKSQAHRGFHDKTK